MDKFEFHEAIRDYMWEVDCRMYYIEACVYDVRWDQLSVYYISRNGARMSSVIGAVLRYNTFELSKQELMRLCDKTKPE